MASNQPAILAFAGSTRTESVNKKLVRVAASGAELAGAKVTFIDLRDYPLPLYDGDLEEKEGFSENVMKLKALFKSHQGLLIATPEYNSAFSGVLKNMIDWVSRPEPNEGMLACFNDKVCAVMSASPGGLGGMRSLVGLRALLENINVLVLPGQIAIGGAYDAFNEDGTLKDATKQASVQQLGRQVAETVRKLSAP